MRRTHLPHQFPRGQIDNRNRRVFLVFSVEPASAGRDSETMRVGRASLDRAKDLPSFHIYQRDDRAVFARDVEQAIGTHLQPVRRNQWREIDVPHVLTLLQIDDGEDMTGLRIASMNSVAIDRNVSGGSFRDDKKLVRYAFEAV